MASDVSLSPDPGVVECVPCVYAVRDFTPLLRMGMRLQVGDNTAGTITDVLIDRHTRSVHSLVVNYGGFFGIDLVMPVTWISRIEGTNAVTNATMAEVLLLPHYSSRLHGPA